MMTDHQQPAQYDFGLTPSKEEWARRLHREAIVVDMLFTGPCAAAAYTEPMNEELRAEYKRTGNASLAFWAAMALPGRWAVSGKAPIFREWWDASGVTAGSREVGIGLFEHIIQQMATLHGQFNALSWLTLAMRADDIRQAKAQGHVAGFIHTQDTRFIERDLDRLNLLYDLGMRVVQLTYNNMNYVGAGCTERTDAGLSYFGTKVIHRMNELRMMIDVSHTGRQSTLDACRASRFPVSATHTGAKALSPHDRCKSDEELKAIASSGGLIGVVTVPSFLSGQSEPTIENFLNHVDYIANLVGAEHVGIGTDWPNSAPAWILEMLHEWHEELGFREEHRVDWLATLKGFQDHREFINITRGLIARNYSDHEIRGILGGNFLRVFEQVCG